MEERKPLINDDEDSEQPGPISDIKRLIRRQRDRQSEEQWVHEDNLLNLNGDDDGTSNATDIEDGKAPDNVTCVFVIAFDTRQGNVLEWSIPEDVDLCGVEFKAMPSGAHTIPSDFLYFRKDNMYGVSSFGKITVDSEEERGCRMKSVGVFTTSYSTLHRYKRFLEEQVNKLLQNPGNYEELTTFYNEKKGVLQNTSTPEQTASAIQSLVQNVSPDMKITHPVGSFTLLVRFFGPDIFLLWKVAMLQKRMLFFSPPPIGVVCYRVYCTTCLTRHRYSKIARRTLKPFFYVNIADIEQLERENSYIACTTEKVFSEKPRLYDVYIDNRAVKSCDPSLKNILKANRADEEKYQQLLHLRQEHVFLERIGESEHQNEEDMFISYFSNMNDRIFSTLYGVSRSDDKQLTSDHMIAMGLDPKADKDFLMLLLETYNIDATLVVKDPCCPI